MNWRIVKRGPGAGAKDQRPKAGSARAPVVWDFAYGGVRWARRTGCVVFVIERTECIYNISMLSAVLLRANI